MTDNRDTILIVDDTPSNLDVLFQCLETAGYKVLVATNADTAFKGIEHLLPDIILLDVVMPGIDGFETCSRLKDMESTKDIPIIFMTALSEPVDEVKGFKYGAVDYITKPFQVEIVLARINTHLTLRKLRKTLQKKNAQLEEALSNVKILKGLLPICAKCKKIRDDKGYWNSLERYIQSRSDALFTHSICPECADLLYGDQEWYKKIRDSL